MELISKVCEKQNITLSVFELMELTEEKILKIHDFLA